jgi:toxin YoeB
MDLLIDFTAQFKADIPKLKKENTKLASKILELINSILETPFEGIGKPEPLKNNYSGYWSRRIDEKHRLIYKIEDNILHLVSCYGHYDDK